MIDIALVATIAGLLGLSARDLVKWAKSLKEKETESERAELLAARYEGTRKAISAGLHVESLVKLYPDNELARVGFSAYKFRVGEHVLRTTIVNVRKLLSLRVPIRRDTEKHRLDTKAPARSKLTGRMVAEIIADIDKRKLRVWNQATYCVTDLKISEATVCATFAVEDFLAYRYGVGALWDELVQGIVNAGYSSERLSEERTTFLRYRTALLPTAESLANYMGRTCVAGIHGTVAMWRA